MTIEEITKASPALTQAQLEAELLARDGVVQSARAEMRTIRELIDPLEIKKQIDQHTAAIRAGQKVQGVGVGVNLRLGQ